MTEIACVRNDMKHFTFNFKQEFLPPNCAYGFGLCMYDAYKSKPKPEPPRAAAKRNDLLSNPAAARRPFSETAETTTTRNGENEGGGR